MEIVNNFSERIHKIKCKQGQYNRKVKIAELNISIATIFLNMQTLRMI